MLINLSVNDYRQKVVSRLSGKHTTHGWGGIASARVYQPV